jgi:hypothetical protein
MNLHPLFFDRYKTLIHEPLLNNLQWWSGMAGRVGGSPVLVYGGTEAYIRQEVSVCPWFSV